MLEHRISNQLKDFLRAESVKSLVEMTMNVLPYYQAFYEKTVRQTLKVISQLIDWNDLGLFGNLVPYFLEFLKFPQYRAYAFECIGSIVDKGMSETDKIAVID